MGEVVIITIGLIVFGNSCLLLVTDSDSYNKIADKYSFVNVVCLVTFLALFVVLPWQLGATARSETSVFLWKVWSQESQRHGYINGAVGVVINLIFLLWVFVIPGHLYANSVAKKTGNRPACPYLVNALIGVIICTPGNPLYKAIEAIP